MRNKSTGRWKPVFTLAHLEKLPLGLKAEGEKIRTVYAGFERAASELFSRLYTSFDTTYPVFLKNELYDMTVEVHQQIENIADIERMEKERWFEKSLHLVLASIIQGHDKIDLAYASLKRGNTAEFAGFLSEAGCFFGRLTMVSDLFDEGVYDRIGSIQSALTGAALGGEKSGVTRRKQSRVPTPEALRVARQKLIDAGKPQRDISAMLAKKYDCTTDHIRKVLKRD